MIPPRWVWGMSLAVFAGAMQGAYPLPMKYTRTWRWENIWLASSMFGLLVFPWITAAATIPSVASVLADCPPRAILVVFLFGAGWGVGGLLFGLGVHRIGLGLALGIVIGLTSTLGSLAPLALFHPERLRDKMGLLVLSSVVVTLVGLLLCTVAGIYRERGLSGGAAFRHGSYIAGVIVCVASGVLSPLFNFALICGDPVMLTATSHGTTPTYAPNLIWAIAMSGGMIPTTLYCASALRSNGTWMRFGPPGQIHEWALAITMGALFAFGNSAYGIGAEHLGSIGPIVGWPVFMAMQVVVGNVLAFSTGEWTRSSPLALRYLAAGNLALVVAIFLIAPAGA
jgi:L-rhamnose-H+ transport protein